ncbi:MAG: hypothetical protein WCI46_11710 [Verrucomicrobiota bacterium]
MRSAITILSHLPLLIQPRILSIGLTIATLTIASTFAAPPKPGTTAPANPSEKASGGVFYLTEAISIPTDSGVIGAPAGTKVTRTATTPSGMKVKLADGTAFTVKEKQVTPDAAKGAELATLAAAEQANIAYQTRLAQETARANEAERQRVAVQAAQEAVRAAAAATPAAPAASAYTPPSGSGGGIKGTSLDEKPKAAGKVTRAPTPPPIQLFR